MSKLFCASAWVMLNMRTLAVILLNFILSLWISSVESTGTIKADNLANLDADARELNRALSWLYTARTPFLRILPHRTCEQRSEIWNRLDKWKKNRPVYYEGFDTAMIFVIMGAYRCGASYYTYWIKRSMFSESNYWPSHTLNTKALIELLVMLSVDEPGIKDSVIQSTIWQPSMNLKRYWKDYVPGDFGHFGSTLLERNRDISDTIDRKSAREDAMLLMKESNLGFNDHREKLDEILFDRSVPQARLIMTEFKHANNMVDLWDVVRGQLKDKDTRRAYSDLITCMRSQTDYLAIRLKETIDGLGTDDTGLGRLIVWRSEIDLYEIGVAYQKKYGRSLRDSVREDTSGFQRNFLLAFMGA